MRKTLFMLLFICLSIRVYSNDPLVYIDTVKISKLGLNGRIKSCRDMIYHAVNKSGKTIKGKMCSFETNFACDDHTGPLHRNRTYVFDERGRQIKLIYDEPFLGGINSKTFEYRNDGLLYQTTTFCRFRDTGNKSGKTKYYYTSTNKIASTDVQDINGKYAGKESCEYNDHGDIVKYMREDRDGVIDRQKDFEYIYENNKISHVKITSDESYGTTIESNDYDSKGRLLIASSDFYDKDEYKHYIYTTYYEYTTDGRLTREYNTDVHNGITYDIKYTYDLNNQLIMYVDVTKPNVITTIDPVNNTKCEKYYDRYDNPSTREYKNNLIVRYSCKNVVYTYKYKFDIQGNWIKAVEYRNKVPTLIRERTIEYYPEQKKIEGNPIDNFINSWHPSN